MKQIHNWEELAQLEPSATHYLEIDLELGCGRLRSSDGQYENYLSTHTFYGYGVMEYISEKLQACGFDVELIGWDKEPKNKVELDCGYRSQIRLVNERSDDSLHFNWHTYARESVGLVRKLILRGGSDMEVYLWQLLSLMSECEFIDVYVNDKRVFHGQVFEYEVADCESKAVVIDFKIVNGVVVVNCKQEVKI